MRKSRLSQYKQNKLSELFIAGVTARAAAELTGVHKNTAAYHFHRLRVLIAEHVEQHAQLNGEIEIMVKSKLMKIILAGSARENGGVEQPAKSLFSGFYSGEAGFTGRVLLMLKQAR